MTTISAKIIADSVAEHAPRLSTLEWVYPRWIHAEGRTHRLLRELEDMEFEVRTPSPMEDPDLSRNAASSRAVPVKRLIREVIENPAIPLNWGANQKGMQADKECNALVHARVPMQFVNHMGFEAKALTREEAWLNARDLAVRSAMAFDEAGYHKQIVNRLLEPFTHIKVVVSGTQWSNFLALRLHKDAEPHIRLLAEATRDALAASTPTLLRPGQWHLPYVNRKEDWLAICGDAPGDSEDEIVSAAVKLSVARCASVSYNTVEGFEMTLERATALHDKLVGMVPMHASPTEHQARVPVGRLMNIDGRVLFTDKLGGNFGPGWVQYRKTLPGECQ